ncbi:MAG: ABC transporter ATP-binding protein [Nitrospirae bacterium]|nr:MAG: ABC transporter ATP-binding protein [Nitrospirota bacterium]
MIRAEGIKKSFQTEAGRIDVLKGIDLEVKPGEMIAILGASGVGKSTLLHILGTIDRPTEGRLFYEGEDVFGMDEQKLASFRNRKIGFVFQFHHLLPEFTALENVMMPGLINGLNREEARERAVGLLAELGLSQRLYHRPGELSGGEQQRVAVARAMLMKPLVVLADEPTGNLDTKTGEAMFEVIVKMNREKETTFVIVTHNEALALKCSRQLMMVDGVLKQI